MAASKHKRSRGSDETKRKNCEEKTRRGKVAVITGGSSGIGLATAKRFVEEGAYVFITGRRKAELDKAVAEIGKKVTAIQSDVSNLADLDRLFQTVEKSQGRIDILFANAGVVEPTPTQAVTPEHYDRTFDINARGVFFTVQKALPLMKEGGSIILNGSGVWQKGIPIYATYGGTKAALRSFVRTWTAEFASKGIRANMISPGPVETPILQGQFGDNTDAMREQFKTRIPMKRLGRPEEVAAAAGEHRQVVSWVYETGSSHDNCFRRSLRLVPKVSNFEQSERLGNSMVQAALTWQSPEKADSPLGAVMG